MTPLTPAAPAAGGGALDQALCFADYLSPKRLGYLRPEAITFEPFAAFPAGAEIARVVGNPAEPGPYVVRVRVAGGVVLLPHRHPEDRVYTVISGVFYIGLGDTFEAAKLEAFGPGSVFVLPSNTPHFHCAVAGTYITQVSGMGPLGIDYELVEDDPRGGGQRGG